ncbi:MAG: cell surface protein, partial [Aliifodinibius sp.]|nr:cell surface protein [Fodinibius sp.]NIV10245.1 cell surface protein [Fodinibius sp.]NIY23871.1 cell surface protein [Fodinibius sp.]
LTTEANYSNSISPELISNVGNYYAIANGRDVLEDSRSSVVTLLYSTYLGGDNDDYCRSIALDDSGCAYVIGLTTSSNFPSVNPYQTDQAVLDVFVTKLSNTGSSLIYSTYLGGNDIDYGYGIAVDDSRYSYLAGFTASTDFPTSNPYQIDQAGLDVFITKLSSGGNSIVYSTYLGGNGDDYGHDISLDDSGCTYVTGNT